MVARHLAAALADARVFAAVGVLCGRVTAGDDREDRVHTLAHKNQGHTTHTGKLTTISSAISVVVLAVKTLAACFLGGPRGFRVHARAGA
jgi:hypothetical protein